MRGRENDDGRDAVDEKISVSTGIGGTEKFSRSIKLDECVKDILINLHYRNPRARGSGKVDHKQSTN
jgi:hypothetical protein